MLGNVIVADNLVNANEIAKVLRYNYKIVTLEGDIVNKGGSMTGGKNRNASTPMTLQKELTQVEQSLEGQRLKSEGLYQQQQALSLIHI